MEEMQSIKLYTNMFDRFFPIEEHFSILYRVHKSEMAAQSPLTK